MSVHHLLRALAVSGAALLAATAAQAQPFPAKPIKIIVGFAPGSATDTITRLYGQKLSELLKTPVIVDNKPGGLQVQATRTLITSPADGYTLMMGSASGLSQAPGVRHDLPYDPAKDLTPIALLASSPGLITVTAGLPVKSIAELVSYAKAHPGELSYATGGVGSAGHLAGEYFARVTGISMVHVPYKSDAEVARELSGGTVQVSMSTAQFIVPLVASGKVRALAVNAAERLPGLPDVPTVAEVGIKGLEGMSPYTYFALVGPAGLPGAVVSQLNAAVNQISADPEVGKRLRESFSMQPAPATTADGVKAFMMKDLAKWRELGKDLKLE
ncbi:MAG: tripartite tricarboxylate transporter substrate binding protein [Rubrivivax sp.]